MQEAAPSTVLAGSHASSRAPTRPPSSPPSLAGGLPAFPTTFTGPLPIRVRPQPTLGASSTPFSVAARAPTWSDGRLTLRELVDLYGAADFDVLCVTDHALRSDDPWRRPETCVHERRFGAYLAAVEAEASRALALHDLLVVPGLEITHNNVDPDLAAHAVAVGLREHVSPDAGLVGRCSPPERPARP